MLDGDDYCSANWLVEALQVVSEKGNGVVVHPEYTVSHGACHLLGRSVDQLSEDYPVESCFKHHPWVSVAVAEKAVFRSFHTWRPESGNPASVMKIGIGISR